MIRKWLVAVLTVFMIFLSAPPAHAITNNQYENRVQVLINERHEPNLISGRCADGFAERHARHLSSTGHWHHQDLGPVLGRCNSQGAGEIIAKGTMTPRETIKRWLDSDTHRPTMLKEKWDRIGVGVKWQNQARVIVVVFLDK